MSTRVLNARLKCGADSSGFDSDKIQIVQRVEQKLRKIVQSVKQIEVKNVQPTEQNMMKNVQHVEQK